jgi:hypothetical protein
VEDQQGRPDQGGGLNQFDFVSVQPVVKRTPRSHTELDLDVLYMVGSRIS